MLTYALIVSKENCREGIFKKISSYGEQNIKRVCKLEGEYDLLAELKVQNEEKMKDYLNEIRNLEGVVALKTFTVVHKTKEHDQLPKFLSH